VDEGFDDGNSLPSSEGMDILAEDSVAPEIADYSSEISDVSDEVLEIPDAGAEVVDISEEGDETPDISADSVTDADLDAVAAEVEDTPVGLETSGDIPEEMPPEVEGVEPEVADIPTSSFSDEIHEQDRLDILENEGVMPYDSDYDFDGFNIQEDLEGMDAHLDTFKDDTAWNEMTMDDRDAAIEQLAGYAQERFGIENPPEIVFENDAVSGNMGGYQPDSNTLVINEHYLDSINCSDGLASEEAVDTVFHEMWHAHQYERDGEGMMDDYIDANTDYEAYLNQPTEREAWNIGADVKARLRELGR